MCCQPVGTLLPDCCEEIHVPAAQSGTPHPPLKEPPASVSGAATGAGTEQAAAAGSADSEVARIQAAAAAAKAAVVAEMREMEIQSRDPHTDDRNHWHAAGHNRQQLPRITQPLVQPHGGPRPQQHRGTGSSGTGDRLHVSSNVVPGRPPSVRNNIIPGKPARKLATACDPAGPQQHHHP